MVLVKTNLEASDMPSVAFTNVLVIFGILKGISVLMPESGFKLGFTNGLMSESMIVWFLLIFTEIGRKNGGYLCIISPWGEDDDKNLAERSRDS